MLLSSSPVNPVKEPIGLHPLKISKNYRNSVETRVQIAAGASYLLGIFRECKIISSVV